MGGNTSVDWHVGGTEGRGGTTQACRPRPGRPVPNCLASDQANAIDFIRQSGVSTERQHKFDEDPRPVGLGEAGRPGLFAPRVQPFRGSYNRHVCSPQVEVTTAMHVWTALLSSQANHSLAYKLSNLSLAYKLSNPPWRPIKGSPHFSFSTHHLEKRRVQDVVPLSRIGRV